MIAIYVVHKFYELVATNSNYVKSVPTSLIGHELKSVLDECNIQYTISGRRSYTYVNFLIYASNT